MFIGFKWIQMDSWVMLFTPWNCAFVFNMFNLHKKILECAADWYSQKHQLMGIGAQRRDTHLWICGPWNGSVELPMFLVIAGHGKPRGWKLTNLEGLVKFWVLRWFPYHSRISAAFREIIPKQCHRNPPKLTGSEGCIQSWEGITLPSFKPHISSISPY
jgi:hypothetical protein